MDTRIGLIPRLSTVAVAILLLAGAARASGNPPTEFRVIAASPLDEVRLELHRSGSKFVGGGVVIFDDGSRAYVSAKVKPKSGGFKYKLKPSGSPSVKIKAMVFPTGSGFACSGKVKVKWPNYPKHKLKFYPGDVVVVVGEPPVARIRMTPASGPAPLRVRLDAGDSHDPDGSIARARWTIDGGRTVEGLQAEHTFIEPGQFRVELEVTDDAGLTARTSATVTVNEDREAKWTYMVYLGADNNLTPYGIRDLREMESIGSDGNVNIVVQHEFSHHHNAEGTLSSSYRGDTLRSRVVRNVDSIATGTSIGNVNMAKPETLRDFIQWAAENHPAERYALILWDHGGGWREAGLRRGAIADDTTGDFMSLPDLARAVRDSGVHFDMINFDACLMAMHQVAYEYRGLCDSMVFSQANEPGDGDPYDTILADLVGNPNMDGRALAIATARRFREHYSVIPGPGTTKSAVDMNRISALHDAVTRLGDAIVAEIGSNGPAILAAVRNSQHFDWETHRDLYDICAGLTDSAGVEVGNAARAVMSAVDNAVISNEIEGASVSDSHGIAIWAPLDGEEGTSAADLQVYATLASNQGAGGWNAAVAAILEAPSTGGSGTGGFAFAITWNTDADVDLGVQEPDGNVYFDYSALTSPNGTFFADDPAVREEAYFANSIVARGTYKPVVRLYFGGSNGYADVTFWFRANPNAEWQQLSTQRLTTQNPIFWPGSLEVRTAANAPAELEPVEDIDAKVVLQDKLPARQD